MRSISGNYLSFCCMLGLTMICDPIAAQKPHELVRLPDERMEFYEVSAELQQVGRAVCAIISRNQFAAAGRPPFTLNPSNLEASLQAQLNSTLQMCGDAKNQMQKTQPVAAECTATLIAPNMVVTAGHCFKDDMGNFPCDDIDRDTSAALLQNFYFVFDYHMAAANTNPTVFDQSQVYTGVAIIGRELSRNEMNCQNNRTALDWAVVQLDRDVTGRTPVTVAGAAVSANQNVFAIGFGGGLPMKFSMGGVVTGPVEAGFQVNNLEVAGGNSGGPIFDLATRTLVGVVSADDATAPANDYIVDQTAQCIRPAQCPGDAVCTPGETVVCAVTVAGFATAIQQAITGMIPTMMNTGCGAGACGAGLVGLLPLMMICWLSCRRVGPRNEDRDNPGASTGTAPH